jgi:hypothetical protein
MKNPLSLWLMLCLLPLTHVHAQQQTGLTVNVVDASQVIARLEGLPANSVERTTLYYVMVGDQFVKVDSLEDVSRWGSTRTEEQFVLASQGLKCTRVTNTTPISIQPLPHHTCTVDLRLGY